MAPKNISREKIGRRKHTKVVRALIILIALLLIAAIAVLIFEFGLDEKLFGTGKSVENFDMKDECSILLNTIIHVISDDGQCRVKCREYCEIKKMDFSNSEFTPQETTCNKCTCYCA